MGTMPYVLNVFLHYPTLIVMLLFFGTMTGLAVVWDDTVGMVMCGILTAFLLPWTIWVFTLNCRLKKTEKPRGMR